MEVPKDKYRQKGKGVVNYRRVFCHTKHVQSNEWITSNQLVIDTIKKTPPLLYYLRNYRKNESI